jgi:serine O-acetyltransferase
LTTAKPQSVCYLIYSDLYRYYGRFSTALLLKELLWGIGFRYTFWLRLSRYFKYKSKWFYPLFLLCWLITRRYMFKFGIQIPYATVIGPGFYIGHFCTIVISSTTVIGKNCNISQGVTIGLRTRGEKRGSPTIGDNVFIGPGAKIFGNIRIGNNVAIGANAVVTKDVEDHQVVAGVPAKVISQEGTEGVVTNTDY